MGFAAPWKSTSETQGVKIDGENGMIEGFPSGIFYFLPSLRTLLDPRGRVGTRDICHGTAAS